MRLLRALAKIRGEPMRETIVLPAVAETIERVCAHRFEETVARAAIAVFDHGDE